MEENNEKNELLHEDSSQELMISDETDPNTCTEMKVSVFIKIFLNFLDRNENKKFS